jgi:hypothetical protein
MTNTQHFFRQYTDHQLAQALEGALAAVAVSWAVKDAKRKGLKFAKLVRAEQARRAAVDKDVDDFFASLQAIVAERVK